MIRLYTAAVVLTLVLFPASGESAECANSLSRNTKLSDLLDCIKEMNREIMALEEQIPPINSILIMDNVEGCPAGWEDFSEANGRMIVGAQRGFSKLQPPTTRLYRDIGGEEQVTLTVPQMPRHRHGLETVLDNKPLPPPTSSNRHVPIAGPYNSAYRRDFYEGADQPHPNMPPYIALYFCKKD